MVQSSLCLESPLAYDHGLDHSLIFLKLLQNPRPPSCHFSDEVI